MSGKPLHWTHADFLDDFGVVVDQLRHARDVGDSDFVVDHTLGFECQLLQRVVDQLRTEYRSKGKSELFEQCRSFLVGSAAAIGAAETARKLNMTEGALRVAIHRLRERYRELLRIEVAGTIADETTIEDELLQLRRAIQGENL